MSVVTADQVKSLRERTGAGMMDCKFALEASAGDVEQAVDFLRKKGMAAVAKRAGREAKDGMVVARLDTHKAAIVEVNCETDFVARTDDFKNLALWALEVVHTKGEPAVESSEITQRVAEATGKIGEKIIVRRGRVLESPDGALFMYIHSNQKLGVLVELSISKPASRKEAAFQELGKNIAMQIAASNPVCVTRAEVPSALVNREKEIYKEEVKNKPANIVDKIIQGKLEKFYQTVCLLEQPFIRDDKKSVQSLIDETAKKIGDAVQVRQFARLQLGETLQS